MVGECRSRCMIWMNGGITFQDGPPVYQTLGGLNQEAELHARSYSSQFPIHRQQDAYTVILIHLYKALVLLIGVQRRATRLSRDLRNEPYNIRLTTLGLPTLQFRRDRADMLQVFKILNGYVIRGHRLLKILHIELNSTARP